MFGVKRELASVVELRHCNITLTLLNTMQIHRHYILPVSMKPLTLISLLDSS